MATTLIQVVAVALQVAGAFFFLAGTVGLLRFPDTLSRLHALTKADNLGLGFIVLGLMLSAGSVFQVIVLAVIWLLAVAASTTAAQMIAQVALREQGRSAGRE